MSQDFWDPGAYPAVSTRDPTTGVTSTGHQPAPGIIVPPAMEQPSFPWPDELSSFETITFAGVRAPGICRIRGVRRLIHDLRQPYGASGATNSISGQANAEFEITLTLWTARHFALLQQLYQLLFPPPTETHLNPQIAAANNTAGPNSQLSPNQVPNATTIPATVQGPDTNPVQAVKVQHPMLATMGVYDIFATAFHAPEHVGLGVFECMIEVMQFLPIINSGVHSLTTSVDVAPSGQGQNFAPARKLPPGPDQTSLGAIP